MEKPVSMEDKKVGLSQVSANLSRFERDNMLIS